MSEKYEALCHAMQTGVAYEMEYGSKDTEPKHLRVGINSALVNDAALTRLLIKKGIITEEEYTVEVTEEMQREVTRYEERLTSRLGTKVSLG